MKLRTRENEPQGFAIDEAKMLHGEPAVYRTWPKALRPVAFALAKIMERFREMQGILLGREQDLDERASALLTTERQLHERQTLLHQQERASRQRAERAAEQLDVAARASNRVLADQQANAEWASILAAVAQGKVDVRSGSGGRTIVPAAGQSSLPGWMNNRVKVTPPWAANSLNVMKTLSNGLNILERERAETSAYRETKDSNRRSRKSLHASPAGGGGRSEEGRANGPQPYCGLSDRARRNGPSIMLKPRRLLGVSRSAALRGGNEKQTFAKGAPAASLESESAFRSDARSYCAGCLIRFGATSGKLRVVFFDQFKKLIADVLDHVV